MNWALSILRRRRRSQHRLYEPDETSIAIADPDVHAAPGEPDVKHRSVVGCRHHLGWPVAETAKSPKNRQGTAKSRHPPPPPNHPYRPLTPTRNDDTA